MRVLAIAIAILVLVYSAFAEARGGQADVGTDAAFEARLKTRSAELARNPAFERAVDGANRADEAYIESRLVNELGLANDERLERLFQHMEAMRALMYAVIIGAAPPQPSGTLVHAEQALDANLAKALKNKRLSSARLRGIAATQKKWLVYRDALMEIFRLAAPDAAQTFRHVLTQERAQDLAAFTR